MSMHPPSRHHDGTFSTSLAKALTKNLEYTGSGGATFLTDAISDVREAVSPEYAAVKDSVTESRALTEKLGESLVKKDFYVGGEHYISGMEYDFQVSVATIVRDKKPRNVVDIYPISQKEADIITSAVGNVGIKDTKYDAGKKILNFEVTGEPKQVRALITDIDKNKDLFAKAKEDVHVARAEELALDEPRRKSVAIEANKIKETKNYRYERGSTTPSDTGRV